MNRREFHRWAAGSVGALIGTQHLPAFGDEQQAQPLPWVEGSMTLAVLPDTQMYCERWPDHFYRQTEWIVENRDKYNIQFVLHLGDITNRNTPEQWEVAKRAISKLDGQVPYALATGNHDLGPGGNASTRETLLHDYFTVDDFKDRPTFGGVMTEGRLENTFHTFRGLDRDFLVLALEWGPRNEVVAWANEIVAKHPEHAVILITHAYVYSDETRYDWAQRGKEQNWNPHSYKTAELPGGVNDGEELWQKLVSQHPNFLMTLNGHVLNDGLGRLTSAGKAGNAVHQQLVNYQMKKEGGEGFLRLVEFLPDGRTLQVRAYSPSLDQYKTDEQNQFRVELNPGLKSQAG